MVINWLFYCLAGQGELESEVLSPEEQLQEAVVDFLTHIKDNCNATQKIIDEATPKVNQIIFRLVGVVEVSEYFVNGNISFSIGS